MDKQDLLKLEKMASLTPKEIENQQPAVFSKLGERASVNLKNTAEARLKNVPARIKRGFAGIDFKPENLGRLDVKKVLHNSLIDANTSADEKKALEKTLAKLPELGKLDDFLQPDIPIMVNPVFQPDLMKAKVYRLSDIAGLSQMKTDKAMVKELSLTTISEEKLDELVTESILTAQEAKDLGLAANLYTLLDADFALTELVSQGNVSTITGKITDLADLIVLDKKDWEKLITDANVELPDGLTKEDYGDILYKKVENLFPSQMLTQQIKQLDTNTIKQTINELKPVFEENENPFDVTNFDDLKTGSLPASEVKKLKAQYETIDRISKVHPGLNIRGILNDKTLLPADKGDKVSAQLTLFDTFVANNKDVNYLALSYTHDSDEVSALNFQGFKPAEKTMVLNSLKSYQRVYSITQDTTATQTVMAAGFQSAYQITSVTLDEFKRATKLDTLTATKYFEDAHESIIRTTGVMGSVLDILTGSFDWTSVGNTGPSIRDYLKDIPGYQDLFGDLAFCDCEHCQSIYSPAAYFVDLMQFVDKYVLTKHFTGAQANHVLNLKVRRPNLWTLPLTCENTSTLVPYLDIINEILESYIAKQKGFTGDLNDRNAVADFVYKREIALEKPGNWKANVHSFTQPFHLPLESVSVYLSHFKKTRADIAHLLDKPDAEIAKAKLGLSEKEFQLITTADNAPAFLNSVYGITFAPQATNIQPFDAQLLLKPMGVSRKELGRLMGTRSVTSNGTDAIVIQGEKKDNTSIQNDIERIKNLTYDALDRAHRFVRLWKKTSWSIEELDLVLTHLATAGIATGIEPATVTAIGELVGVQEKLSSTVEVLISLWSTLPVVATADNQKSFLDALFNQEDVVIAEGVYPKAATPFIHPALIIDRSTASAEFSSGRLMTGLNRSDADVLALIQALAQPLGMTNISSATESDRGFALTLPNLTLLYRHAKVADLLKLSIQELFQLIKRINTLPNGYIETVAHLKAVLVFHDWWKTTGLSLDELHFITSSPAVNSPENFKSKGAVSAYVLGQVKSTNALLFADSLFAYFDDVTEEQSKAIVDANPALIAASGTGENYWLTPAFNPATAITVPAGISRSEADLRAVLTNYHPQALVPHFLAEQLGIGADQVRAILNALSINLDDDAYMLELQEQTTPAVAIPAVVEKLLPLSILFRDKRFDATVLAYVLAHLSLFDIADINSVAIPSIHKLYSFLSFLTKQPDGTYNIDLLNDLLSAYTDASQFQNADQAKLAALLKTDTGLLASLHPVVGNAANAINGLTTLKKFVELTTYIGIGGNTLPLLVSNSYDDLNQASAGILAAFRTKYRSESERKEKLEPYQDRLRGKKRASLTTYLIHSGFPQFENENDLFHYFLIDTELEGCARTSWLVAATMSLQLYIHRILLNLEQDDKEPGAAGKMHVRADDVPGDEWSWRKNYRVWEANRKVFLYPENYIEPEFRDDKTPLFDELESELLQQEINADTVLDAYAKYMRGFDEVAHLQIAGSFHEKDEESKTDVLHLFGVTADEPPLYYYRKVENIYYSEKEDNRGVVWAPWQKINVQIPVRKVAPIVFNGRLYVFWVRITTLANTVFDENRSIFVGYSHKVSIDFTTLKLDGTWTPPQKLNLKNSLPFTGNGIIQDPLADDAEIADLRDELHNILRSFPFFDFSSLSDEILALKTPRYDTQPHYESIDEYTLRGPLWDQVYPAVDGNRLLLTGTGYQMRSAIDFYNLSIQEAGFQQAPGRETWTLASSKAGKRISRTNNGIYRANSPTTQLFDNYAYGSLLVNTTKFEPLLIRHWNQCTRDYSFDNVQQEQILDVTTGTTVGIINGAFADAIIDAQGDILLLQGTPVEGNGFLLKRIGTTLSETLTRTLFTSGVDTMLSIATQKALKEAVAPVTIINNRVVNQVVSNKIDFKGAYGNYYREIYFHIPYLIANHLNSQGKFADAQKWYHYIFNPSATEVIDFSNPALTAAQKKKMELDRNWQYLEFREINTHTLKDQLNDKRAIEVYKKDPFNPHAIARLRLSAYQKNIVMKYIDNLLDWGDYLFTQDTMVSVNEATLLYVIAKEILGNQPAELGDCGEGAIEPKTYEKIGPLLSKGSEFLAELETYTFVRNKPTIVKRQPLYVVDTNLIHTATANSIINRKSKSSKRVSYMASASVGLNLKDIAQVEAFKSKYQPALTIKPIDAEATGLFVKGTTRGLDWKKESIYVKDRFRLPSFGISILSHVSPVFCVPGNKDLLEYWNRVDDRLYKIRNCMNIQGQRRQLALFAPEIDPRLLVRARAAGLSLDDILNSLSGNLPPYRFSYIIERAKAYTALVQGFGASLLGALEKRDAEELAQLRLTQQQNILEMSSKSRRLEIDSANETISVLNDRVESLTYQIGYYNSLIAQGRNGWEITQSVARHTASVVNGVAFPLWSLTGVFGLIPQVGSPFAMKYGGVELSRGAEAFAKATETLAVVSENLGASAGLEAGFERRQDGWDHQRKLLEIELRQTEKNLTAAEIRRDILIESEKIHQKAIEHNNDIIEFHGERFSNLGLYTWLSTTMQRLFREAYNNANSIARLAEQAYRFERDDDTIFLEGNYFESARAGLLSGDRLLMALQAMERRYLETNYRKNEIDQAFSLTQLDPAALLILKQTGTCTFEIPEVFFDLFYPGQFRRKIQSVRLTIPSVTGPYINISATLSLVSSKIRMEARLGTAQLKDVPKSRTTSIATSTAQNDAGVFQLNFRDDRYMPFEGAGTISAWKLSLPKTFRQFDYNTINDIIIHVSYTAEYDELFRDKVEELNEATEGTLINTLKTDSLARTFSLRQEFSNDFYRLTQQTVNQPVMIKIQHKHFPLFMNGRTLRVTKARLVLVTPAGQSANNVDIVINDSSQQGFARDAALGNLYTKDLGNLFNAGIIKDHTITIANAGDLAPAAPGEGNVAAIDDEKLNDIILLIDYKIG